MPPTPDGVETDEVHWIGSGGGPVRVRQFRNGKGGVQPALIYMNGGDWVQGSPETHWDITARLAAWAGVTVISVDCALAPEHPCPAVVLQCRAVLRWVHARARTLGIDTDRIALGGDSAGGNLAAVTALWARDQAVPHGPVSIGNTGLTPKGSACPNLPSVPDADGAVQTGTLFGQRPGQEEPFGTPRLQSYPSPRGR
ncbi:alpha/beta hydrolase [Chachezhania sediminis]|uniref:alpha/beta hydrolase n=1 Tax=Chachezhania sediminis TaxID=2599291 RepID=UPI001E354050|nr:alpha/beta hydrolase fold domain-containing protein [Chachezhania sediminis]